MMNHQEQESRKKLTGFRSTSVRIRDVPTLVSPFASLAFLPTYMPSYSIYEFLGSNHRGLPRKDFLRQEAKYLLINVCAGIGDHKQTIVHVSGPTHRGKDFTALSNARQYKRILLARRTVSKSIVLKAPAQRLVIIMSRG